MTYLVSINYGGNETEVYVTARNEAEAIAQVRATLTGRVARWANVFIG
ncbi:hypothetical protein ACP46_gp62 [Rhizobium phage RHEph06]|uniref:Uncharacterized protein n=2 Tax=Kleczkowskavirus RHEph4 TaxID=1921526 RepID=L7TMI1_9CAUD|nr:hypothetical protein ACP46_gp62 [Rhizobium phage RHEph06]YP_009598503.1 hypothetical protein FDH25_gp61 [Rhizobium phage RHEph04]AGC35823.1 hypothetical protein RHEph05_gp056 [Rhizobium phage RHEph05]QXV74940.1 hypothetical protein [Rhizobium phage RHEph26]AGC35747.1 hypothetical protein RHEph04_gp061 [Rhizobium phage RHEph04]AGC35904.1 hypothetical protein RHEph06_gp062 [Rhizobium phage RHEph06]